MKKNIVLALLTVLIALPALAQNVQNVQRVRALTAHAPVVSINLNRVKTINPGSVGQQLVSNGPNADCAFQTVVGGGRSFKGHVVPTGTIDSVNTRFMLPDVPIDSSEYITLNGVVQYPTLGYTRGHDTILFVSPPPPGSHIDASYFK